MKKFRTLAALASTATLGLALAACGSSTGIGTTAGSAGSTSPAADSSTGTSGASAACPSGTLTMGVEPYDSPKVMIPAYQRLTQELGQKLGCTIKLDITDTYAAEVLAMQHGQLDLGEFGPAGFVFANKLAGAIPVASFADKNGKPSTYTAGIWVKKGSPITSLKDLAGHTLALSSAGSTSGDWVPRYALMTAGVMKTPTDTSSVNWKYAGGHPESLLALTHGTVDAAEINSQQEASSIQQGQFDPSQYTEIWKSSPILNDPITMSPKLSPAAQAAIKSAILGLSASDLTQGGKSSIADELVFTPPTSGPAMVPVTVADYKQIFDLASKLQLKTSDLG